MSSELLVAQREIKLLRAALNCRSPYQQDGSWQRRLRLEKLANRCEENRRGKPRKK